jgi:hypothetical protein
MPAVGAAATDSAVAVEAVEAVEAVGASAVAAASTDRHSSAAVAVAEVP